MPMIDSGRRSDATQDELTSGSARPQPPAPLVDVRDVSRRFGAVVALDGVSLAVNGGAIHALLGPNGAGKTTLLRVLTGLVDADSGHVRVAGLDPAGGRAGAQRSSGRLSGWTR